ncbi:ribosomal protection-like ABC-F family protein [Parasediminibacterium sp. JCM 36343]|uniref:ribosomal protection-like ABC-F family protein n=1 Tax=Parasediminibacterium sp. JCM 36343 TaxID=3374279 RepID=UPI00397A0937
MLIGLQNVTFEFGARVIVEDATWHINPGERIGLIGYNGTGKSTLLKVLVGQYLPSKGSVEKGRDVSIGYLHQDLLSFETTDTILEVAMGAFERVRQLEKEIEALGIELETREDEKLLTDYTDKLHEMDVLDGYNIQYKTEEVLHGLGFTNEQMLKPYQQFSGGWRMRVLLAKMILQAPDVLLLDEPTNHLDLPSIEWLEKYLLHYQGSVVIVSHDKYFMNRMVNKIVEIYQQELHIYSGDYEYYEIEKEQRVEIQQRAFENQQDYIKQQERFIERFRAKASKAAAAQSAMKRLDKIDRIENVQIERPNIKINFQVNSQPGRVLVTLKEIHKQYGDNLIVENGAAEIDRGDKIALIGANGKGKSTLLRIIAGTEENFGGERVWGHNVESSFYAQHQLEALTMDNTILNEMMESRSGKTELELRSLLGCFLFSGDDTDKKIKLLSGGEKARVALAKVIVSKSNFLMLDEPTNHLDMHSVELLADALNKYEGSLILVSHDRYFVSKTANKIWEIVDHEIKEFKGTYAEYLEWKERMAKQAKEESRKAPKDDPKDKKDEQKSKPVEAPKPVTKPRIDNTELKKLQNKFQKIEQELEQLKKQKQTVELELAAPDNYKNATKFAETERNYKSITEQVKKAESQYEELFEQIMEMEN